MTAPDLGPCQCVVTYREHGFDAEHEHSDFKPYPCAELDCPCRAWQAPGSKAETGQDGAQTAQGRSERPSVTIPAGALDFSRQRITDAAAHLDDILTHHGTPGDPDDPLAVCGLADLLEQTWPENIDPFDIIALAARRLIDATKRIPRRRIARGWGRR